MEDKYKEQIIEIASSWWAEVIKDAKLDCGANSSDEILATALGEMLKKPVAEDNSKLFKEKLKEYLDKAFDDKIIKIGMGSIILGCDYNPCKILYDLAKECDISENNFPWKTTMWIGKNYCKVRYGYSSPIENLFESEEYWLDTIESDKKAIKDYENRPDDDFGLFPKEELIKEAKNILDEDKKKYEIYSRR